MHFINISHKKNYKGTISDFSNENDSEHSIKNILTTNGYWSTKKSNSISRDYFIIDYKDEVPVNYIEITPSQNDKSAFPSDFRIESSINGKSWKVIQIEKSFNLADSDSYFLNIPLTVIKFIKMLIIRPGKVGTKYYTEIDRFSIGISGIKKITASSSLSYKHDPSNLFDLKNDTYWESNISQKKNKEFLNIDLGESYNISRLSFSSADTPEHGFPENLAVSVSKDNDIWNTLFDQRNFTAEPSTKYIWDFNSTSCRFINISMDSIKTNKDSFSARLSELEILSHINKSSQTSDMEDFVPNASIFQYGIVKLAKDGEDTEDTVVRSNDSRLKEATTISKGVVQLAENGQEANSLAVQASDSRLKKATELRYGIVRLGKDREESQDVVVRGNDSRLQKATETNYGIMRICPNGESSEFGVVAGNDSRIKHATKDSFGIIRLADNGEATANCVVQGNDSRLKDASTNYKGIVELAEDGEDKEGVAVQGSDKRLKDASITTKGIVELAENGEDKEGAVVQGNDKRLKDATTTSKGIVELAENGEDKEGAVVQSNDKRLKDATTSSKGIIELAKNGEDREGTVIQGNDKRLKDATTVSKGIVRLAEDGETGEGIVIQSNDKRLKDASISSKGIVELAEDGEDRSGVVVQGSDKRLKDATTSSKGIVELAENGEDKEGAVVQSNDKRLKDATTSSKGIVELAENGEDRDGVVVQGSDKRLKDSTTSSKGIVELAENGEDKEGAVVQSNDKRLKDATTSSKGIVELAENGEDREGVAVQGSDNRLKYATEETHGIVKFAKNGDNKKLHAVQADDNRLFDARTPLPHEHEYAPLAHDYSSHLGNIKLTDSKEENITGIVPPSDGSAIIYAKNESHHPGAVGIVGINNPLEQNTIHSYGIIGHGMFGGVRGQSSGNADNEIKGAGVIGISRFGAGGVFASEHNYSLVADGYGQISEYDDSAQLKGDGNALFVKGRSAFSGQIEINNISSKKSPVNIVEIFEVDEDQFIVEGDILIISEKGKSVLKRASAKYSKAVIGIVSGNPSVIINNSGKKKKIYPIALAGKVLCRIDAREKPVKPGDLIVTSNTPGCGMAGIIDSFDKIGTVIGKALDNLDKGIGTIPVYVAHM